MEKHLRNNLQKIIEELVAEKLGLHRAIATTSGCQGDTLYALRYGRCVGQRW